MTIVTERPAALTMSLSADEALVLFEAASKLTDDPAAERLLDEAELMRVFHLVNTLESELPAVLAPDYREQLAAAKARLTSG